MPLIPWVTDANQHLFMQVDGKPLTRTEYANYHQDGDLVGGLTAPYALGETISLLEVSEREDLLERGVLDKTDSVTPGIYLTSLWLTRPGSPPLMAVMAGKAQDAAFVTDDDRVWSKVRNWLPYGRFRRQSYNGIGISGGRRFLVNLKDEDGNAQAMEFMVQIDGIAQRDTGLIRVNAGEDLYPEWQSMWFKKHKPLEGYKPAGYELFAGRINYNRRLL